MAVKEKQIESPVKIEWTPENEVHLFLAMIGHKPVGDNAVFHIICIWEKFREAVNKEKLIPIKAIYDHLSTLYDLDALTDPEDSVKSLDSIDFSLPDSDFLDLKKKREEEADANDAKQKEQEKAEVKEKPKEIKKEKESKEIVKKDMPSRENKVIKEQEKKKEESKKTVKEPEAKKEKQKEATKEVKKDTKQMKTRPKGKEDVEETVVPAKKERRDSDSSKNESMKRVAVKRPTRQSTDSIAKATSSPRDTPPLKRRRL